MEEIDNRERGCGFLKEDQTYIRNDLSASGTLPPFVVADPPIPHLELSRMRSWKRFQGIPFELGLRHRVNFRPTFDGVSRDEGHTKARELLVESGLYPDMDHAPQYEVDRLIDRMRDTEKGQHVGEMITPDTHDLLMWVGKKHYPEPDDFIKETISRGLNKAIPTSKKTEPPTINPGITRVFLIHPRACRREIEDGDDDTHVPGIIGYSYLNRVIYTKPSDGKIPKYMQDWSATGKVDVVEVGPETRKSAGDDSQSSMEEFTDQK